MEQDHASEWVSVEMTQHTFSQGLTFRELIPWAETQT